jgi:hypothetical protein
MGIDMTNCYKGTITIDKLLHDEQKVVIEKDSNYIISYPVFLKYFKKLPKITKEELIIGINFTYGWMPTTFKFKNSIDELDRVVELLNKARSRTVLSFEELELMKSCLNNSTIGLSKLLHFVNPKLYPIWDRKVCYYLYKSKKRIESCHSYLCFLDFCRYITNENGFAPIKSSIENKVGYKMSAIRTAELVMFYNGF